MRISRIAISNHSRVGDLDLEVRRHAVIVGANDVGKSSILRMLHSVLGSSTASLYQSLSPSDIRDPAHPLVVDIYWHDFTDADRAPFHAEISVADDEETESLWVQMSVEVDVDDDEAVTARRWFPEGGHERGPNREQLKAFGWRYLRATRGASIMDGPLSPVRTLLDAADLSENEKALKDLLTRFNDELDTNESVTDLLGKIAIHLSRAMPRQVERGELSIRSIADPEKDMLGNVSLFLNREKQQVSLQEQSDGVRQLMAMTLYDLAEVAANVISIDEPELHLHPTSQRTVADLLSGEGNQKVIVTHSPYIVHRFEPAEVVAVDRHGTPRQISASTLSKVEKVRAHWWSPRLLEALAARHVLLVEGAADRVIVEAAANALEIDLDRLGTVVVDLDGADKFKHVFPLLGPNGFGPTLLGLVDKKESEPWIGAFQGKPADIVDTSVFVSDTDLEAEYAVALGGQGTARALIDGGHCKENSVLQSVGVTSVADITPAAVAEFCRKDKVSAAVCIGQSLTQESAGQIGSVARLLRVIEGLDLL